MGALAGLGVGIGLLLVWQSLSGAPRLGRPQRVGLGTRELLAQAGLPGVRPGGLVGACVVCGACTAVAALAVSQAISVAVAFGLLAAWGPVALVRHRRRRRRAELRELWPDVVDNLASAVRAGLSLPEAVTQLGTRGPEVLRTHFVAFGEDYRATGRFVASLDRLKESLADPVADRIVEALRLAHEVGGTDLGRLLRTLSTFLREDVRTRAELETRQGWTVNAARLAVAAPWVVLAMLSFRPEAVAAYDTTAGTLVLAGGAAVCFVAYRLMLRIARLPEEERVLR
jgi:tight adherence protein B